MRASPAARLRASLVWRGDHVEERVLEWPAELRVGARESADLELPGRQSGLSGAVIVPAAAGWRLPVVAGMSGSVELRGEEHDLAALAPSVPGAVVHLDLAVGDDGWILAGLDPEIWLAFEVLDGAAVPRAPLRLDRRLAWAMGGTAALHALVLALALAAGDRARVAPGGAPPKLTEAPRFVRAAAPPPEPPPKPDARESPTEAPKGTGKRQEPTADPKEQTKRRMQHVGILGVLGKSQQIKQLTAGGQELSALFQGMPAMGAAAQATGLAGAGFGTGPAGVPAGTALGGAGGAGGAAVVAGTRAGGGSRALARERTQISFGKPGVAGGLSPDEVVPVVRARLGAIQACYEQGLQGKQHIAGTLKLKWLVRSDGSVGRVGVESDGLGVAGVTSCVMRQIERMRFPEKPGPTEIVYPFVFTVAGK